MLTTILIVLMAVTGADGLIIIDQPFSNLPLPAVGLGLQWVGTLQTNTNNVTLLAETMMPFALRFDDANRDPMATERRAMQWVLANLDQFFWASISHDRERREVMVSGMTMDIVARTHPDLAPPDPPPPTGSVSLASASVRAPDLTMALGIAFLVHSIHILH